MTDYSPEEHAADLWEHLRHISSLPDEQKIAIIASSLRVAYHTGRADLADERLADALARMA